MQENDVISNAILTFGENNQIVVAVEELSELQKELCKRLRGNYDNSERIAEEIADVQIMIAQLVQLLGIDEDVEIHKAFKLQRLEKRIVKEQAAIWANHCEV